MVKISLKYDHKKERRLKYPTLDEQADAIYKGFKAIRDAGITLPSETLEWLANIDEIKARYPKR